MKRSSQRCNIADLDAQMSPIPLHGQTLPHCTCSQPSAISEPARSRAEVVSEATTVPVRSEATNVSIPPGPTTDTPQSISRRLPMHISPMQARPGWITRAVHGSDGRAGTRLRAPPRRRRTGKELLQEPLLRGQPVRQCRVHQSGQARPGRGKSQGRHAVV